MLVVFHFDGCVDAAGHGDFLGRAVFAREAQGEILLGLERGGQAGNVEGFGAVEVQSLRADAFLELQREHAHADKVRAVDAFEASRDDRLHAEKIGAFGGPVAAGAGAVFVAGEDDEGDAVGFVEFGGVVNGHLFAEARCVLRGA